MGRLKTLCLSIAGGGLLFAHLSVAQNVPAPAISASAHGGYFATYGSQAGPATRRIEFTATRNELNEQRGQGSFFNTLTGVKVHFTINCLRVEGNVAVMTGIWDDHGKGDFPYIYLKVVDNGQGRGATDQVSPLYTVDFPVSCQDDFDVPLFEASGGNIQVR
jgi:hypothetical protein